jgi:2-oxoglutarate ferredoxin oxidoreductase subunit beta
MVAVQHAKEKGEILTGLLYMKPETSDLHEILHTTDRPLNTLSEAELCPGSASLDKFNGALR